MFFFKQKTAYEMRISDWSSDVCSSDLFDGKVVAANDDAIVVKLKPSEFAVLDPHLVTTVPSEGAKVHVQPYARRRFDGLRADTPEVITEKTADGVPYTITRHRSEEHTSELQSLMRNSYAAFCLKKKNQANKRLT